MLSDDLTFDIPCPHCHEFTVVNLADRDEFISLRRGRRWVHINKTCEVCNKRMTIWFDCKHETAYASWVLLAGKPRVK